MFNKSNILEKNKPKKMQQKTCIIEQCNLI